MLKRSKFPTLTLRYIGLEKFPTLTKCCRGDYYRLIKCYYNVTGAWGKAPESFTYVQLKIDVRKMISLRLVDVIRGALLYLTSTQATNIQGLCVSKN